MRKDKKNRCVWKMPEWMEPYRYIISSISGGHEVEEIVNGRTSVDENAPLALLECGAQMVVSVLRHLHDRGMLREMPEWKQ